MKQWYVFKTFLDASQKRKPSTYFPFKTLEFIESDTEEFPKTNIDLREFF